MDYIPIAGLIFLLLILGIYAWPSTVYPWLEGRAWRKLAARIGLSYKRRRILGIPKRGRVLGVYRGHEIALDAYKDSGVNLRMRVVVSLNNRDNKSLLVSGKSLEKRQISAKGRAAVHRRGEPPPRVRTRDIRLGPGAPRHL